MAMVKARRCRKCGRIYENLGILQCECKEDLPFQPEYIEKEEENQEERADEQIWYVRCNSNGCGKEYRLASKDDVIPLCKECGSTDISNQEPYTKSDRKSSVKVRSYKIFKSSEKKEEIEENDSREVQQPDNIEKAENSDSNDLHSKESVMEDDETIKYVELKNLENGKIIQIKSGSYMIGKLGEVEPDYFMNKRYVGREHAMIFVEKDLVSVMDNNSKNWTKINNTRIINQDGKMEINTGDQLTLADLTFEVNICR